MTDAHASAADTHVINEDRFAPIPEALLYDPDIPAEAVRVYGVLRRHGSDPTNCFPSHARIAALIGKSPRSVPAWIRALEAGGWVQRVARWRNGDTVTTERPAYLGNGWEPASNSYRVYLVPRVPQRGVHADERGEVRAAQRGECAPHSAPNESHVNESKLNEENTLRFDSGAPPAPPAPLGEEPAFAEFWQTYPNRRGKDAARRAFTRARARCAGGTGPIIAGARRYRDDPNRVDQYTKHPSTWLNGGCWDDPPLPARAGPRPRQEREQGWDQLSELMAVVREREEAYG